MKHDFDFQNIPLLCVQNSLVCTDKNKDDLKYKFKNNIRFNVANIMKLILMYILFNNGDSKGTANST